MTGFPDDLRAAFLTEDPSEKAARVIALAARPAEPGPSAEDWPDRPGRPARPELVAGRDVPRRSPSGLEGRIGLLHALAHIELNAIDLAVDIIGRFHADPALSGRADAFAADWMSVAADESKHFLMLSRRLEELGSSYGRLTAHDGLWQSALRSKDSLLDRLAIAPLTQEARGLDVTPGMVEKLKSAGDGESARLLDIIYRDEIGHVATGMTWFAHVCRAQGLDMDEAYPASLGRIGLARPHAPFNIPARREAGLAPSFDRDFAPASAQTQANP